MPNNDYFKIVYQILCYLVFRGCEKCPLANIMPKTKFQNVIFTLMMSFLMVYAMICYNIALNIKGMNNQVFLGFQRV